MSLGAFITVTVLAATAVEADDPFEARSVRVVERGATVEFGYLVLRPARVEPGRTYAAVLFLHGAGERGIDNRAQVRHFPEMMAEAAMREKHPCFVVVPQCRADRRWVEVDWSAVESTPQAAEPTVDLAAAVAALNAVMATEPIDPARVYVTGLSMGGFGAWDLASRLPERFAAVIPICGGGDEGAAARLRDVPIWCFHGDADPVVPVDRSRRMVAAVRAAGGRPRYTEQPGVDHFSWMPAYRDPATLEWLFAQRKSAER